MVRTLNVAAFTILKGLFWESLWSNFQDYATRSTMTDVKQYIEQKWINLVKSVLGEFAAQNLATASSTVIIEAMNKIKHRKMTVRLPEDLDEDGEFGDYDT